MKSIRIKHKASFSLFSSQKRSFTLAGTHLTLAETGLTASGTHPAEQNSLLQVYGNQVTELKSKPEGPGKEIKM